MYFHNLKFDGSFILSYLLKDLKYEQAYEKINADGSLVRWLETKDMKNNSIKYSISEMGQWYYIIIKKRAIHIYFAVIPEINIVTIINIKWSSNL